MRRAKQTVRALYGEAQNEENTKRRNELASWAMGCEREARIKSMVSLARAELGIPVLPDDLDRDPWLFNVANGTIDLRSGELREHRREDLITKLAPVVFAPGAECPVFLKFLTRVTAGTLELIAFLQRAVGYSLTGTTSEQALLILHGQGANGKSTLLNAVRQALGEYAKTTRTDTLLIQRQDSIPNDIAALKGARMVTAQETEAGRRLAESLVKQLTGGDPIAARFLHQEWFEFPPVFKLWLATNHKPRITGTDHAIWRRIRLVPFTVKIPDAEQDPALPEKLTAELPGILAWAVRGCLAWQRDGLGMPDEVRDATAAYRDEMDVLGEFIAEYCVISPSLSVPAKALYAAYLDWCGPSGERPISKRAFGGNLAERGFDKRRGTGGGVVWFGIALRDEANPSERDSTYSSYAPARKEKPESHSLDSLHSLEPGREAPFEEGEL